MIITTEKVWEYIEANEPFTIYLSDGRHFLVKDRHWITAHPSRQGSDIVIYGPGPDEFHLIPLIAITSISRNGSTGAN